MCTSWLVVGLVLGGSQEPVTPEPAYEFKLTKVNDIAMIKEKHRTVFRVTNPFGIGQATIHLKAGQWPENVVLRFQYANEPGKGFTSLEHLRLTTERIHTEGSLRASGQFGFAFLNAQRQLPFAVWDERRAVGQLRILVEPCAGALEVTLPPHLLTGSGQLAVSWIDAYRN